MKKTILAFIVALVLILSISASALPLYAQETAVSPKSGHWSQKYIDQLATSYRTGTFFETKDLDAPIRIEDFQRLVRIVIDQEYDDAPDSITREAIVHEFTEIWADQTGVELDQVPTIKMIVYADMDQMENKYKHGITVAYMREIARGRGNRIFDPKTNTTYGELATLLYFTKHAIDNDLPDIQPIAPGRFETRGSYTLKDGKVIFDFELISHFTEPQELSFSSGQQFELTITDEKGTEVYKYSDGKFFTMALVYKTINPGQSFKWQDEWDMTNKEGEKLESGNFKAVIKILASSEKETIDESHLTSTIEFSLGIPQDKIGENDKIEVYFICSEESPGSLYPVEREAPEGIAPLESAIQELLKGPTEEERKLGYWSHFSEKTSGMLRSIQSSADGKIITIDFADFSSVLEEGNTPRPTSFGPGGVMADITWTVFKQFPEVEGLRFSFDGSEDAFWSWLNETASEAAVFTRTDWEQI